MKDLFQETANSIKDLIVKFFLLLLFLVAQSLPGIDSGPGSSINEEGNFRAIVLEKEKKRIDKRKDDWVNQFDSLSLDAIIKIKNKIREDINNHSVPRIDSAITKLDNLAKEYNEYDLATIDPVKSKGRTISIPFIDIDFFTFILPIITKSILIYFLTMLLVRIMTLQRILGNLNKHEKEINDVIWINNKVVFPPINLLLFRFIPIILIIMTVLISYQCFGPDMALYSKKETLSDDLYSDQRMLSFFNIFVYFINVTISSILCLYINNKQFKQDLGWMNKKSTKK